MARRTTSKNDLPWGVYARLSAKKPDRPQRRQRRDDETVERQIKLCRAFADEHGLPISDAHIFIDNHRSAWIKDGAERPGWVAMKGAVGRGELRGILIYKVDRFVRRLDDAVDIVNMAKKSGLLIDSPGSGEFDLTTNEGRDDFYEEAVHASKESTKISRRVKDAFADMRAQGELIGGGRVFGFERSSDLTQRESEADVIREAARRMLALEPLAVIAADLRARGVVSVRGTPFRATELGRVLSHHRYGGKIVHEGVIVGSVAGNVPTILDADTYERVQTMLTSRRRGRRATERFELTGIARCGKPGCGRTLTGASGPVTGRPDETRRIYRCPPQSHGCGMVINADSVEGPVRVRALELLADKNTLSAISARDAAQREARSAATARLAEVEDELVELEVKKAMGPSELLPAAYDRVKPILVRRRDHALAELDAIGGPSSSAFELPTMTEADWEDAPVAERRQVIARLGMVITVLPTFPGAPRAKVDPRRVVVKP